MSKISPFNAVKPKTLKFRLQDVAVGLLQLAGIHEGYWQLQVMFGNSALNMNLNGVLTPTALINVAGLQLSRVEQLDALSVDAAVVNPQKRLIVPAGPTIN